MVLLDQLVNMLGRRAAGAGLVHSATGHQRHDREHLGAGAQLQDGEQIGEVVAQDVAGHGDGVLAADDPFQRVPHGPHLRHDLDLESLGVVLLEVGLDLLAQLGLVRALGVEPEHRGHAGRARPRDGKLDPVADRRVLDDGHPPDVAGLDVVAQQHLTGLDVDDVGDAVLRDLEGLVVAAVLLGTLGHETDVGYGAHRRGIELAVRLAEVDHLLVDPRERRLRIDGLGVLELAVGAVHLPAGADHRRHRGVDDDIAGRVEVGDAARRVHHRELGPVLVHGVDVADDLLTLRGGQRLDLGVQIRHAVVDVHAELVEDLLVLGERVLVEHLDRVAEHDRMADLHHGRLDMQREHDAGLVGVFDLLFEELAQRLLAHEHAVDDVALVEGHLGLEDGLAAVGLEDHLHRAGLVDRHRLLTVVEVPVLHGGDVGTRGLRPLPHAVRVFPRIRLDRLGGAPVRVAFAQYRIDRAAEHLGVARLDLLLLVGLRLARVVGQVVALLAKLLDRGQQLRNRGADVGQLDDVGLGQLGQLAQLPEVVGHPLFLGQIVGELGQDARGHGDVTGADGDAGCVCEGADHGQEGVGRQQRRLVGQRVDDGRLLGAHVVFSRHRFRSVRGGSRRGR